MNHDDSTQQTELPRDPVVLDPSMNLYYNTRTHKCQYYYGPDVNEPTPVPRSLTCSQPQLKAIPSQGDQHFAVHGLFVSGDLDCWWQKDSISQNVKKGANADGIKSRNDSGIGLSTGSKIEPSVANQQPTPPPPQTSLQNTSTDKQTRTVGYLKDHATLSIDLRRKSNITVLSSFLGLRMPLVESVRRIQIKHHVIECADTEELAVATVATTTINFHGDGSLSIYCSFPLTYGSACVCDVERSLESLLGAEHKLPELISAKRQMWRKLSSNPRRGAGARLDDTVPQEHVPKIRESSLARTSMTELVRSFVELLQPQLGSDPEKPSTVYGMEMLERSVCSSENFDPRVDTRCMKRTFHMSGWVDGVAVDISGLGRWSVL